MKPSVRLDRVLDYMTRVIFDSHIPQDHRRRAAGGANLVDKTLSPDQVSSPPSDSCSPTLIAPREMTSLTTTVAPARASPRAMARPIPVCLPAPVHDRDSAHGRSPAAGSVYDIAVAAKSNRMP